MKCEFDSPDCLNCPYSDCIASDIDIRRQMAMCERMTEIIDEIAEKTPKLPDKEIEDINSTGKCERKDLRIEMGVIIPKMDMPDSCYYCPLTSDGWHKDHGAWCNVLGRRLEPGENARDCPLRPLDDGEAVPDINATVLRVYSDRLRSVSSKTELVPQDQKLIYHCSIMLQNIATAIEQVKGEKDV